MGNELFKEYEVQEHPKDTGGFNQFWKIHDGRKDDASKRQVSIFMIEKKQFEKKNRDEILSILRKEAQTLAKLRHPNVLNLVEPLKEDEKRMAFVTEQVEGSLMTVLSNGRLKELCPTELELKQHVQHLLDTVSFLHNDLKMVHLNLAPENIFVTPEGKWKLGGFIFTNQILVRELVEAPNLNFFEESLPVRLCPNLSFSAPETVAQPAKCHFASDIFALGCLLYALLKAWFKGRGVNDDDVLLLNVTNARGHAEAVSKAYGKTIMQFVPAPLQQTLQRMIVVDPYTRARLDEVTRCAWLKDPLLQSIKVLESLIEKDTAQQLAFLQGLNRVMNKFDGKNIAQRIVPALVGLFKFEKLGPFLVALAFRLNEKNLVGNGDFMTCFWPEIKGLSTRKDMPAQVLFQIVYRMNFLHEVVSKDDFNSCVFSLYLKCFECGVAKLEELALKKTAEFIVKKFDYATTIKVKVLPRILQLCQEPNHPEVRVSALLTLKGIHSLLDKNSIQDSVLNTLEKVRKLPNNTAKTNMLVLSLFEASYSSLSIDILSGRLLGSMIPFLADQNLTRKEFNAYYASVLKILNRIKEERISSFGNEPMNLVQDQQEEINEEIVVVDISKDLLKEEGSKGAEFEFLVPFEPATPQESTSGLLNPPPPQAPATSSAPLPLNNMMGATASQEPTLFGVAVAARAPAQSFGEMQQQQSQAQPTQYGASAGFNARPFGTMEEGHYPNIDSGGMMGKKPGGGWMDPPTQPAPVQAQQVAFGQPMFGKQQQQTSLGQPMQLNNDFGEVQFQQSMPQRQMPIQQQPQPPVMQNMAFGQPAPVVGGALPKGNLTKLSYDPFAELNQDIVIGMPMNDPSPASGYGNPIQPQSDYGLGGYTQQQQFNGSNPGFAQMGTNQIPTGVAFGQNDMMGYQTQNPQGYNQPPVAKPVYGTAMGMPLQNQMQQGGAQMGGYNPMSMTGVGQSVQGGYGMPTGGQGLNYGGAIGGGVSAPVQQQQTSIGGYGGGFSLSMDPAPSPSWGAPQPPQSQASFGMQNQGFDLGMNMATQAKPQPQGANLFAGTTVKPQQGQTAPLQWGQPQGTVGAKAGQSGQPGGGAPVKTGGFGFVKASSGQGHNNNTNMSNDLI